MAADDQASLATRMAKDHHLTPTLLAGRWAAEAAQAGLATGEDLARMVCGRTTHSGMSLSWDELSSALVDPETGLCARTARFTQADVIEALCARSGGRLATADIVELADRFLASDLVVRLVPDGSGQRRPAQWSTTAHRAVEDHVLALIDTLAGREDRPIPMGTVEATLAVGEGASEHLGEDQAEAVRVLTGPGGSLRTVLAPAGYGKTTMLHTAARAVAAEGRPIIAVATTAKAVAELAGVGLDARTIARLRLDLANGPLPAGIVVVLDEISQTPTHDAGTVLAAVDACPGGSLWVLGDPGQSQPVGAGGIADHLERLAEDGGIPSARLSVNRRQVDRVDRQALDLLRHGDVIASQQLRDDQGWEHEAGSPGATREAMADAVAADIDGHGPERVAVLVVSHGDAEDLADRIRSRLTASATITGPALVGPGWTTDRSYRTGDRILLHTRYGPPTSRLVNGTTATVRVVSAAGLTVEVDGAGTAILPAGFVSGTRRDGSPNLSHAWARTIDGAQGGTWETCHLLGTPALDAYRGYTGQSRSRQPTHTWNTAPITVAERGGRLVDQPDPAEVVADALARRPDPRLAAHSDPWAVDRQLRERIGEHEQVLAGRPEDRSGELAETADRLARMDQRCADLQAAVDEAARQLAALGRFGVLGRHRAERRRILEENRALTAQEAAQARADRDHIAESVSSLEAAQDTYERFETDQGWRCDDIKRLRAELDQHWVDAISVCVWADDPLAFGIDRLRHARAIVAVPARTEATIPGGHQPSADRTVNPNGDQALIDDALDTTRPARVEALADQPPPHLLDRLGPVPTSAAGRAVWCYWATGIETVLDHTDGTGPIRLSSNYRAQRRQIVLADRHLTEPVPTTSDAPSWAAMARHAAVLDDQLRRRLVTRHVGPQASMASRSVASEMFTEGGLEVDL